MLKRAWLPLGLAFLVALADQTVKFFVSAGASPNDTKMLIPNLLEYCYLHNDGAAMGLFSGGRWPLIVLTVALVAACVAYLLLGKRHSALLRCALALFIGGGVGNLIDRVRLGYVVDYVRFPVSWFSYSFNLADAAVCIGAGLLVLELVLELIASARAKRRNE